MNPEIITNNISTSSIREKIQEFLPKSKAVIIAVAFFSDSELIKQILEMGIKITLIVSLRPPTNFYALKEILYRENLETLYLDRKFLHSKIYAFFGEKNNLIGSIIGSSNLTAGGLNNNIETNVILRDVNSSRQVGILLRHIQELSTILQPDTLEEYKERYDRFVKQNPPEQPTDGANENRKSRKKPKPSRESLEYNEFWKVADKVKDLVKDVANDEYPTVPTYLAVDHFWHWVVKICDPPSRLNVFQGNEQTRDKYIPIFFKEYCKWDKSQRISYTENLPKKSKRLQKLLSKDNIPKLDKESAREVYKTFHATQSLIQRFDADKTFVEENSIESIRKTFEYLLHSEDSITDRIHNSISQNGQYKLHQFGSSCVQELLGWFKPMEMPIRNRKADKAIRLLGFRE